MSNEKPSYLAKKDYGKTPDYLKQRIEEMKEEREVMALEAQGIVILPDEERERILKGLQDNWEKLNKDYQRLSLTVDTVPKIARFVLFAVYYYGYVVFVCCIRSCISPLSHLSSLTFTCRKVNMEQQLKQYEELIEKFSHTKIHVNFASAYQ